MMFKATSSGRDGISCGDGGGVDGLMVAVAVAVAVAVVLLVDMAVGWGVGNLMAQEELVGEYFNSQLLGPWPFAQYLGEDPIVGLKRDCEGEIWLEINGI